MSLESEMKKINANLERVGAALENLAPNPQVFGAEPNGATSFNPVTETKVVEPETKKVSKDPESVEKEKPARNRTVPATPEPEVEVDELEADFDERPPLTAKQVQVFAREKIAEYAEKDPKLKTEIKKKITDLGASMITELDQDGLVGLEKFLSKL